MAEKNIPISKSDLAALAQSGAGQSLYTALRQSGDERLNRAMSLAASGDMAGAGAMLTPLLSDPKIRALVEQLGGR